MYKTARYDKSGNEAFVMDINRSLFENKCVKMCIFFEIKYKHINKIITNLNRHLMYV